MRRKTGATLLLSMLATAAIAKDHLIEVEPAQLRHFAREITVPAGKFKEVCAPLKAGDRVQWRFSSSADTGFNIHFHVGADVSYPEKRDSSRGAEGTLQAERDEHYCWMWKTKDQPATITLSLESQR